MHLLFDDLIIAIALNLFLFLPAYFLQTDKLTDISYSITFIALAIFGYSQSRHNTTDYLAFLLVVAWAIRLGTFLFVRILKQGKDSRFDEMRKSWFSFMRFWFFQGLTVFIVLLPGLLLWGGHKKASTLLVIGIIIWAFGLIVESLADIQKYRFKQGGAHGWIDEGVWRTSRHPNYLGEMTVWTGYWLFAASALSPSNSVIALASPLYIIAILMFFSGLPLLEKSADKKWGHNMKYQQYKKAVPALVPTFSSLNRLIK